MERTLSVDEAAELADVTRERMIGWAERGAVIAELGPDDQWQITEESVKRQAAFQARMVRAREVFESGDELKMAAFIAGIDEGRLRALQEDD